MYYMVRYIIFFTFFFYSPKTVINKLKYGIRRKSIFFIPSGIPYQKINIKFCNNFSSFPFCRSKIYVCTEKKVIKYLNQLNCLKGLDIIEYNISKYTRNSDFRKNKKKNIYFTIFMCLMTRRNNFHIT